VLAAPSPPPPLYPSLAAQTFQLTIWDTAGQERFHALTPLYYRDAGERDWAGALLRLNVAPADGALLVYDITDAKSFERVQHWVTELRRMAAASIKIVICGNKSDMERARKVDKEAASAYAKEVGASHFLTSAKTGGGITEAFSDIATSEWGSWRTQLGGGRELNLGVQGYRRPSLQGQQPALPQGGVVARYAEAMGPPPGEPRPLQGKANAPAALWWWMMRAMPPGNRAAVANCLLTVLMMDALPFQQFAPTRRARREGLCVWLIRVFLAISTLRAADMRLGSS
jgi:signal recognition particle receptor subunit beta